MAFNTQTIDHVQSFNVLNSVDEVNEATREIFDKIATENLNWFEGLMLRNSFIASEDYSGGMDYSVSPSTVNQSNPAGSYRSLLTPKGDVMAMSAITNLSEIEFEKFATDSIKLEINEYVRTPFKLLYAVDTGNGGSGWLVSGLESALSQQFTSAIVRHNNYKVFETLKQGAVTQTDNLRGAQGRVITGELSLSPTEFTNQLIDAIADYNALPEDRYVTGFDDEDLVIAITKKGQAKLLKEKLVMYDGQHMGTEGKFYQGLPYVHLFAGALLFVTKFLNSPDSTIDAEYIITPIGKYAPLLFHLGRFSGRAEVAPFTDGAISAYGTLLTGMKVEEKLDQHITLKVNGTTAPAGYETNMTKLKVAKGDAGELVFTGTLVGAAEYEVVETSTGSIVKAATALTEGEISETITGLTIGKEYHFKVYANTKAAPETLNGKAYISNLFKRA